MLKQFRNKIRGYIPFTNWWLVERKLDKSSVSILDLGCGTGKPMLFLNRKKRYITVGVDAFPAYIENCKKENTHSSVSVIDINYLPYRDKSFDVVVCLQVLEHFNKEQGLRLIGNMRRLSRKQVILTTDLGRQEQEATPDGNELQRHQYIWSVKELREVGFRVYGIGIRGFDNNWLIRTLLQVCFGWLTYYMPRWAGSVLCVYDE